MNFTNKKQQEGDKFSIFCLSVSTYSLGTYDAFSDDFVFDTQIKSQWSSNQLIELGEYCDKLYENYHKTNTP